MFTLKYATILAVLGSALASPVAHHHRDNNQINRPEVGRSGTEQGYNGKYVVVVSTTNGKNPNPPTGYQPDNTTKNPTGTTPTTGGSSSSAAAAAVASSSPVSTGGSSSGGDYLSIANKWRTAMGHKAWVQDSKLESNVLNCLQRSPGTMTHFLNPGSMGQVLAPGNSGNFESVYVGGWLCEIPSKAGLNGICTTMTKGWSHDGQTGHAEILNGDNYSKIGCALFDGIWGCDVA